jgi:hypothetical protein
MEWVVKAASQSPGNILQEAVWDPGPLWKGVGWEQISFLYQSSNWDHPARRKCYTELHKSNHFHTDSL